MSTPRPVIAGRTLLITRRCVLRMFLLKPCKATEQAVLYALGFTAQQYGVELHGLCVESDHYHLESTDHFGYLPDFLRDFHALVAKVMNVHWKRTENLWNTEQTNVVELVTAADAFDKLIYTVTNPSKDHLVEKTHHWPGITSIKAEYRDRDITIRRPHWYFRLESDMPKEVTFRFTRPPGFRHLTHDEWRTKVDTAVAKVEQTAAAERLAKRARIVGRRAIRRQSAFDRPTSAEPRRTIIPRVACKNRNRRIDTLRRNKLWLADYKTALAAYRAGNKTSLFPAGTWQLRVDTHIRTASGPHPLAIPYALRLAAA